MNIESSTPAATPAAVAPAPVFKVFNQGQRLFQHHDLNIKPQVFTTVPEKYVESVKKLIARYPLELTSAETAGAPKATAANVALQQENDKLKAQVEKLQSLIVSDEKDLANKLEMTETQLKSALQSIREASDRINLLESQLAAATDKNKALTADLDRATAPDQT